MIPTTISGLIVFVFFLAPGIAYVAIRERHRPVRSRSAFRETAAVLLISAIAYTVVGTLFWVLSLCPGLLHDELHGLLPSPTAYYEHHPIPAVVTALCVTAAAIAGSATAASSSTRRFFRWAFRRESGIDPYGSGWWVAFDQKRGVDTRVGITLLDGTWLSGSLLSWSRTAEETADRELVLQPPLWIRYPGDPEPAEFATERVVISARQIAMINTEYRGVDVDIPEAHSPDSPTS